MSAFCRFFRIPLSACVIVLLTLVLQPAVLFQAFGAERQMILIEGADYYGLDYETLREVELADCKAACIADSKCKAFTYNTNARWCFLKSDYGDLRTFAGAVSGHITADGVTTPELQAVRVSELGFLEPGTLDEARALAGRIRTRGVAARGSLDAIVADAQAARRSDQPERAAELFSAALKMVPESHSLWVQIADALTASKSKDWKLQQQYRRDAVSAAVNAHLHAATESERARALAALGRALTARSQWRSAIRATRSSLALAEDPGVRSSYDKLMAEHGFRILEHQVDSNASSPRICIRFSDPLPRNFPHVADFVKVTGGERLSVEAEAQQICIDGVSHGERYRILLRSGLPSADGERLPKSVDLHIYVRDRSPTVRFLGRAYVLPKGGEATIPLVSVNTDLVEAEVFRIGDRAVARTLGDGTFLRQLGEYELNRVADQTGEKVWSGTIEVEQALNRDMTTAVPVGAMIRDLEPGAYLMTAAPRDAMQSSDTRATQWFVVSDLGLAAFSGSDGLHALVRSLSTAGPLDKVALRLVARNDRILGRASTDAMGYARFEPGLLRGSGGNRPALLVAEGPDGDYGFLDLTKTPFDLTDRGVGGRPPPKPLDVFLTSERGIYRPGERVQLTALVRDSKADAASDLPLTLVVKRPDGVEHQRLQTQDQGLGARHVTLELLTAAMRGTWRVEAFSDPKGETLARLAFLVEDFEPERLTMDLKRPVEPIDPVEPPLLGVDARFLYGTAASNLTLEGTVTLHATDSLTAFPGFRFGLADEKVEPVSRPIPGTKTDARGEAAVSLELPKMVPVSKPRQAHVSIRILDAGGRPVERSVELPVADKQARIGIKPLFEGAVDEGGTATFEILALGADGRRVARDGLTWTLSRVTTFFQWYRLDGRWDYEPVVTRRRVASGTLDLGAQDTGRIEAGVDWGGYELAVQEPGGGALPASLEFEAGWYQAPSSFDTPDLVKVSLDRPSYRIGETARAHIEPRFPGLALVMVLHDRLVSLTPVQVPDGGATVELPVTQDWGPGAYVTAVLFRPMDVAAKRMPGRALGLTWAAVDPGDRRLDIQLTAAEKPAPRGPLSIDVALGNLAAGEEAYVTVAAVDLGILNLTRFKTPAPDAWYFGQRRLGLEIRDLYGQLIDRMQGVIGAVRSGGDAPSMQFEGPPPTEALVAFHSGILRLDAEGKASASFDLPDFNGSVRLMAMAWSQQGVGHAVRDVIVRDPIVVTASMPRFLAPGDRSRVLIELAHVEGPSGEVTVQVSTSGGQVAIEADAATRTLSLADGARAQILVPIVARTAGDDELSIALTTPDGKKLIKSLTLPVRSHEPPLARHSIFPLEPGADGLEITSDMLSGLVPGSGSLLVSVSGAGKLDVPALVRTLNRFPFGCAEQITSRALPLLYVDEVALSTGLGTAPGVAKRIRSAVAGLLAKQSSGGGFGLWGPGEGDLWLDAYVTDFLTRAREQGYKVPAIAFDLAIDNLRNRLAYASDFQSGGEDIAYALYVLARNGRALIGDLRYYAEEKLDAFATPLAKAQLGAALALYGDRPRSNRVLRAAEEMLQGQTDSGIWRADYGSVLRDGAALLTLAAEAGTSAVDLQALAHRIGEGWNESRHTSTQEQAWLLLAAHALMQGTAKPRLSIDGKIFDGSVFRRLDATQLAAGPLVIRNMGERTLDAVVAATGIPVVPLPAEGHGYEIERAYYGLEGRRLNPTTIEQGQRILAVLTVRSTTKRAARLILDDPLPAGFEIDNPNLVRAGDLAGIDWLGLVDTPAYKEFRAERFAAAVDRTKKDPTTFQIAYLVRAVSPGIFAHPAAMVQDMYRPQRYARTASGRVEVVGPLH
ncbi:MAG: alpha-2-macroglobulin family protein [Chromatiaceae bacterium]|nr:alpha-2-macroglobulin family protein [Chromatiaceae bacterium]